jgi:alpha-maltose-1-phosphate synthase
VTAAASPTGARAPAGAPTLAPRARLIALATVDPLAPGTFSGLSARMFGSLADAGVEVTALATRDVRWHDLFRGAVRPRAVLGRAAADRRNPLVNPNWACSRRAFDDRNRRLARRLAELPPGVPTLQVGTECDAAVGQPGRPAYVITDCTTVQALAAGEFSVSQASPRVQAEAVEFQRQVFDHCARVLTLSDWARRSVVDDYGIDPGNVLAVGAGANLGDPLPPRPDRGHPAVLFVGRDWEQKGGPLLLEAFRRARARVPSARLVVVGCAPPLAGEPGVEVVGTLDRHDPAQDRRLRELYATATCFSILSTFDAFPNVLLEAGAAGLPVVSTAEGSRPEAVVHGVTGLLAESRDPALVADALVAVLGDPDRAAALGAAAARRVADRYTWPLVTRAIAGALDLDLALDPA